MKGYSTGVNSVFECRKDRSSGFDGEKTHEYSSSRRTVLASIATGLGAGIAGGVRAEPAASIGTTTDRSRLESFVETDGPHFVVDGDRRQFSGTNSFALTGPYTDEALVDRRLQRYAELGVDLVRTWAFSEGRDGPRALQPAPGEYNESGFELLDYVVARAGELGIRLVLTLTDYWDHLGGIPQYADWAGLDRKESFYDDETAQELYQSYVEYVLTRENTITGVQYREDPTILAWEPINEARAKHRSDGSTVLQGWFETTTEHISAIDDKHLVSSGIEGFDDRDDGDSWYNDGNEGTDFVDNHAIDGIDICSAHLYPEAWNLSMSESVSYLEYRARTAREELEMPFYLGEFQWEIQSRGDDTSVEPPDARIDALNAWLDVLVAEDADAATVWQLLPTAATDRGGFTTWPTDARSMRALGSFPERTPSDDPIDLDGYSVLLEDDASDFTHLDEASDTDLLLSFEENPQEALRPDGSVDEARFIRDGFDDWDSRSAALIYPARSADGVRVEAHYDNGVGAIDIEYSTDGGDMWDDARPASNVYNDAAGADGDPGAGYWNTLHVVTDLPRTTTHVRLRIQGRSPSWSPQIGRVQLLQRNRSVADYTDENGIVRTAGLSRAVADWQDSLIDTDLLIAVLDAWRSGTPIESRSE